MPFPADLLNQPYQNLNNNFIRKFFDTVQIFLTLVGMVVFIFMLGAGWAVIHFDLNSHRYPIFKKHHK